MQTPVDFGKNFITSYFYKKDALQSVTFLADDIVWVTPDEILHLKSQGEILAFMERSLKEDPTTWHVDVASIKSAPSSPETNIIVYDVHLIPRHKERAVNLRISLQIHKAKIGYELTYIGMSRRYRETNTEQIRSFIENLPSAVIVVEERPGQTPKFMFCNSFFARRLGYKQDDFIDRLINNPFFMAPFEDQKRILTVLEQQFQNKKARTISMQVTLQKQDETRLPYQMLSTAALREADGSRAILYMMFDELTEVEHTTQRRIRSAVQKAQSECKASYAKQLTENNKKVAQQQRDYEQQFRDLQDQQAAQMQTLQDEHDARLKELREQNEKTAAGWQAKYAEIEQAVTKAQDTANARIRELEEESAAQKKKSDDEIRHLKYTDETKTREYESRILKLQWANQDQEKKHKEELDEQEKSLKEEMNQKVREAQDKAAAEIEKRQQALDAERAQMQKEQQKALDAANRERAELNKTIAQLNDRIDELTSASEQEITNLKIRCKEKDKNISRIGVMYQGQLNSIQGMMNEQVHENREKKKRELREKIQKVLASSPKMCEDLIAISRLDPAARTSEDVEFTLSDALNTVRRVMHPKCRAAQINFSCVTDGKVPDEVFGNKSGLQLALLATLENSLAYTLGGGRIVLTVLSDAPVRITGDGPEREQAYFHFIVEDTGRGIDEETLPKLFDDPVSELSIARETISNMGGSIQVRSREGEGSRFEIAVNLLLA